MQKILEQWEKSKITIREEELLEKRIIRNNNKVFVTGVLQKNLEFSYEYGGKIFYETKISIYRLSDKKDNVKIIIPKHLVEDKIGKELKGKLVEVFGIFMCKSKNDEFGQTRLKHYILAGEMNIKEKYEKENPTDNYIFLEGKLHKDANYRKTPFNKDITDLIIWAYKDFAKVFVPVIAWKDFAKSTQYLKTGTKIRVYGRIQSREYGQKIKREVNEISAFYIEVVEE